MKNKYILVLLSLLLGSCRTTIENALQYLEKVDNEDNMLYWSRKQLISNDMFKGESDSTDRYFAYFGISSFYTTRGGYYFNSSIFFDKNKSWLLGKEQWGEDEYLYEKLPVVLKLKFDFLELNNRAFRKKLAQNGFNLSQEQFDDEVIKSFNEGLHNWKNIIEGLKPNFTEGDLSNLRQELNIKLLITQAYGPKFNTLENTLPMTPKPTRLSDLHPLDSLKAFESLIEKGN